MIGGKSSKPAYWDSDDVVKWEREAYSRGIMFDEDRPGKGLYERIRPDLYKELVPYTQEIFTKSFRDMIYGQDGHRKRRLLLL